MVPLLLWWGCLPISCNTGLGSLPALVPLLLLWQQVKNEEMFFLGSRSINSFVVSFFLISSLDVPSVVGSCFLAPNLTWPARREYGSFQGVSRSMAGNGACVQLSLEQHGHLGIRCSFCWCSPWRCYWCCSRNPSALVQFLSRATAEWSRAQGFSCSRAPLRACEGC